MPVPLLLEFFENKVDAPSGLLVDFLEDLKHFLLFATLGQALSSVCQGTNSYTSNSSAQLLVPSDRHH